MNKEKKVIFCIDSYFQLLISLELMDTLYENSIADIVIYSSTPNSNEIANRLREEKIYRNVFVTKTKLTLVGDNYRFLQKIPKYFEYIYSMLSPVHEIRRVLGIEKLDAYDEMIFHANGALPDCIYNNCYRTNKDIKTYRIDDGLGSYFYEWPFDKSNIRKLLERTIYRIKKYQQLASNVNGSYLSAPELLLFKSSTRTYKLNGMNNISEKNRAAINKVFNYQDDNVFDNKNIVFFGTWGNGVLDDIRFLKLLIKYIPKESIIIKVHPREDVKKYQSLGIDIYANSNIPWEVIMLNKNFSNKLFVTFNSSAVFSSRMHFNQNCTDVLVYKCLDNQQYEVLKGQEDEFIKKYKKIYSNNVYVPESIEDLRIYIEIKGYC